MPPAGRVEILPQKPEAAGRVVWVDGGWLGVQRGRWVWQTGGWVVAPEGATYSPWTATRRKDDGRIFFAAAAWRAKDGSPIAAPPFVAKALHGEPSKVTTVADDEAPRAVPIGDGGARTKDPEPLPAPLIADAGPPAPPSLDPNTPLPSGAASDAGTHD